MDRANRDLFGRSGRRWWASGVPMVGFAVGFIVGPPVVWWVWAGSLAWLGTTCVINARRCGRRHCFYTGPFYLFGAAASLAPALGVVELWDLAWVMFGIVIIIGGQMLIYVTERGRNRYVAIR